MKLLALVVLNASARKAAFKAFRFKAGRNHYFKNLTDDQLEDLLLEFEKAHPQISKYFNADMGVKLMNWDSKIAREVIGHFMEQGIPALSVHDSFIIPTGLEDELIAVMARSFEQVLEIPFDAELGSTTFAAGKVLSLKEKLERPEELFEPLLSWQPYKELMGIQLAAQDEYLRRVSPERSPRYAKQLAAFSKWSGAEKYDGARKQRIVGKLVYPLE